uniref:Uncharacterized protein n=1 Tax=Arundo donax TaxID=35708 RepID=A0A0A8Y5U6_ARUDO
MNVSKRVSQNDNCFMSTVLEVNNHDGLLL